MIIFIVAESCTGKTLMAQKLLEKYKIPYFSMDHLKMGLYRADEENCGFTPEGDDELIENKLWPILKGIVMTNIENDQNLIIEGCYMSPERLKEFDAEYSKHILPVFMGFSRRYVENYYYTGILAHRGAIERRDECDDRTIDQIASENERLKAKCERSQTQYFEIDENYTNDTAKIYNWIEGEMSR